MSQYQFFILFRFFMILIFFFKFWCPSRHSFYLFFCNFLSTVLIQYSSLVMGWYSCCCAGFSCCCAGKNLLRYFSAPGFSWAEPRDSNNCHGRHRGRVRGLGRRALPGLHLLAPYPPSLLFFCVGGSWPDSHSGGATGFGIGHRRRRFDDLPCRLWCGSRDHALQSWSLGNRLPGFSMLGPLKLGGQQSRRHSVLAWRGRFSQTTAG